MKTKLPWILAALLAVALVVVVIARPAVPAPAAPSPAKSPKTPLYWVDPMHPQYKSDKPGIAPDCGMDLVPVYETSKSAAPAAHGQVQHSGVATALAERRPMGRTVRTVGRVAVDESRLVKVSTKFDGYIESLYVNVTGQPVRKGEPLFSIYSPELLATQQEYLLALRARAQSPSLLDAARRRLELWDIGEGDIRRLESGGAPRKSLTIAAPASGVVLEKAAVAGARVMAGEPLFTIAGLDRVWVQADVYESELPYVPLGAPAAMTLSYLPGRTWTGRVTFIAPVVDPMTRTVKVRLEFDNRDGALKPDMFADVVIQQPARDAVVVPESAVLLTGTRAIVFVVKDDGALEPREVQVGTKSDRYYEIRGGIEPGTKVATQANFLIDSESRLKSALARMEHEHD